MKIDIVPAYKLHKEIETLFSEYTSMLIENYKEVKEYLDIQNYDEEICHLETKYGIPNGRIYLMYCDEEVAGCIGLRKIDDQTCEMKRFYIREKFRGKKLGSILLEKIIADAKYIGYTYMLLDTLPFLQSAMHLYKKFGFYEIERYNDSPLDASIYMQLDL